jgi:hypothetical protein
MPRGLAYTPFSQDHVYVNPHIVQRPMLNRNQIQNIVYEEEEIRGTQPRDVQLREELAIPFMPPITFDLLNYWEVDIDLRPESPVLIEKEQIQPYEEEIEEVINEHPNPEIEIRDEEDKFDMKIRDIEYIYSPEFDLSEAEIEEEDLDEDNFESVRAYENIN